MCYVVTSCASVCEKQMKLLHGLLKIGKAFSPHVFNISHIFL